MHGTLHLHTHTYKYTYRCAPERKASDNLERFQKYKIWIFFFSFFLIILQPTLTGMLSLTSCWFPHGCHSQNRNGSHYRCCIDIAELWSGWTIAIGIFIKIQQVRTSYDGFIAFHCYAWTAISYPERTSSKKQNWAIIMIFLWFFFLSFNHPPINCDWQKCHIDMVVGNWRCRHYWCSVVCLTDINRNIACQYDAHHAVRAGTGGTRILDTFTKPIGHLNRPCVRLTGHVYNRIDCGNKRCANSCRNYQEQFGRWRQTINHIRQ